MPYVKDSTMIRELCKMESKTEQNKLLQDIMRQEGNQEIEEEESDEDQKYLNKMAGEEKLHKKLSYH